jgi:hypothetical protein
MFHRALPLAALSTAILCGCVSPSSTPTSLPPALALLPTTQPAASQYPLDSYVPGLVNFGFVNADLWRGALPSPDGFKTLAVMGVRTVIDLQERDQSANIPPGVRYVPLRISEWRADHVDTAAVLRAIAECPKPIFIHCHRGRDRTGLAVAAYRLAHGATADQAIEEARRFRINFWWRGPIEARIRQLAREGVAMPQPQSQPPRETATAQ